MKIAIIGTGSVGSALAAGWSARGHEIVLGVRDPDSGKVRGALDHLDEEVAALPIAQAAGAAEVVVLAVPWAAAESVVEACGGLAGKIVVDCTNPLTDDLAGLTLGHDDSAGERLARSAPEARLVKAFNTTGAGNMADAAYPGGRPWMPVCGDDDDAKATVLGLARELGFEAVDAGPLRNARLLEPLALLWIHHAYQRGFGPDFALALLRR